MGVTNHWLSVLAYKTSSEAWVKAERKGLDGMVREERFGVVYMDSNNVPILSMTASNTEIIEIVRKKEEERVWRKGKGYSEWKHGVIYQAFVDQRDLVHMLVQCLCGRTNLRREMVVAYWTRVLDSFDQHVGCAFGQNGDCGLQMVLLLQWLESHYHPHTLRDMACNIHLLQGKIRERLVTWVQQCRELLMSPSGIDTIDIFSTVLTYLARLETDPLYMCSVSM